MKPYIKRSQKDYSLSFKLSVVSQIERGELTFTQATKQYGIQCRSTVKNWLVVPKRSYHKTTNSHHHFRRHPNLLKPSAQQMTASGSEQIWVADITYIPTKKQTVYLSLITDAYSRKIVGHYVHDSLHAAQVAMALKMATRTRQTKQPLVHHSDRGIQYCSTQYQAIHAANGITCSMTDGYDCYQNALAERVNGILKQEFLLELPEDLAQARRMIAQSIQIYNSMRPHLSLEYKTPDAVHQASIQHFKNAAVCSS